MSTILNPVTRVPFALLLAFAGGTFNASAGSLMNVKAGGASATVLAPSPPLQGMTFAVADADGNAAAHPITIDGNGQQIDGAASVQIAIANDAAVFVYDAGQWREVVPLRAADGTNGQPLEYEGSILAAVRAKANTNNPSFTGSATWTGTRFTITGQPAEVQTAAGGAAQMVAIAIADETSVSIRFMGDMKGQTGVAKGGSFAGSVAYQRTGGAAPALVGAAVYSTPQVTTAGDDMTFGAAAANAIPLNAIAADATARNWSAELRVSVQAATP